MGTRQRIRDQGGTLVVFFQAQLRLVEDWFQSAELPRDLPVAVDPTAELYDAIGTMRSSYLGLVRSTRPASMLRALRAGFRPKLTGSDMQRLGADLVVDSAGEIAFLHVATGVDDRTAPDVLVNEITRIGSLKARG